MKVDLNNKVALVTGAAQGIGEAIAKSLAANGARVIRTDRAANPATGVVAMDVTNPAQIQSVIADLVRDQGRLDILVNNAGIIRRNDLADFTEEDWDAVVDTNLKTLFFLSQAAAGVMTRQGAGKIINIASLLSFQGGIRVPSYAAAKSGVAGLTKALANELAPKGVQVNAIAPGYIATNNTAALQADETRNRQILERIPTGRWGKPEDIAGAAVFLASPASDYVTGHVLAVDGGWLAR